MTQTRANPTRGAKVLGWSREAVVPPVFWRSTNTPQTLPIFGDMKLFDLKNIMHNLAITRLHVIWDGKNIIYIYI